MDYIINKKRQRISFRTAVFALGISMLADALDYLAAPIFGIPIIGDVFDRIGIKQALRSCVPN